MERNILISQLINVLCEEFQSVWLIQLSDLSLECFQYDHAKILPDSVSTASEIKNYDDARIWYIDHYVVASQKERMRKQTEMSQILPILKKEEAYYIEYHRQYKDTLNCNQLCYHQIMDSSTGDTEYVVMGFRNIDLVKKMETDELTGLLSRHMFFRKAEHILKEHPDEAFDIMISDIVDFKKINENYGASVADDILKWEAKYLLTTMDESMLLGRYGGDQLVMFGSHKNMMKSASDENRIRFYSQEKENGLPSIQIKFGVYQDISHEHSVLSSCDKARMALHTIKNHYHIDMAFYNDDIRNQLQKRRIIEESMYDSLKNGDFKVYYQPKHNAKTGQLVGAEALIRWIHPEYGFLSPADFIPIFEENGFIVENDYYVWNRTCENIHKWGKMGFQTFPISVNASKLTISNDDFFKVMTDSIQKNEIHSSLLHLEITETLMEEDTEKMICKLNKLRNLGVKIELDDFGSGFSSINVLSTLPIDILKFDMSFMQQFGNEKRSKVLIACINLAKELGFDTVSEGVELKEQNEILADLGVDMIQGYYYSKPLSEKEFEQYMMEHIPITPTDS